MKVAIDIQSTTGKRTGFGCYVLGLLEGFKQIVSPPEFIYYKHDTKVSMRTLDRILWDQVQFVRKIKRSGVDLVHKPCFSGPMLYRGPMVLTVPDIIPYIFPKNISLTSRMFWNGVLIASIKRAKIIITISEASKIDLVKHLGIDPSIVHVTYLAAADSFRPRERTQVREELDSLSLPDEYFMCVGSVEPRKNIPMLISAYLSVADRVPEDLIIVGKSAWGESEVQKVLKDHRFRDRVRLVGYVDDDKLPFLYNAATALLFPSRYEGFGLPALEAMASGCPVVCSNTSSLPEVVGDAAVMADPDDECLWAETIEKISADTKERERMAEAGLIRAQKFSWKTCAEKTMRVYEKAIEMWQ